MFRVLDNGKDATYPESVSGLWRQCNFATKEEAVNYANLWIGMHGPIPEDIASGDIVSYDYSGYGDTVSIIKV